MKKHFLTWLIPMLVIALFSASGFAQQQQNLSVGLIIEKDRIEISNSYQKIVFERNGADGLLLPTTYVWTGKLWEEMFDGKRPFVTGPSFDLLPSDYEVVNNSTELISVKFVGERNGIGTWEAVVEARQDSPLFRIQMTIHVASPLAIAGQEPNVGFWMNKKSAEITIDQGPLSIYGTSYGNSFPAGYLWDDGKEAVVFFNMTPTTWMNRLSVNRFMDCRIAAISESGYTGLGLHVLSSKSGTILPGDMVFEYYLYSSYRPSMPTRLEALDTMINVLASVHPADAPFPENSVEPYETSWKVFADRTIRDLMRNDSWWDIPINWTDPVLDETLDVFRVSPDRPGNKVWDYTTCNSYLAPWLGCLRLSPDKLQKEFTDIKVSNVPMFYDPKDMLYLRGARILSHWNTDMSWQVFTFYSDTRHIMQMLPKEDFNPAIGGTYLMGMRGLIELAMNVDYVFPQFFDVDSKEAARQLDVPELGKVREPWQVGSYSYNMLSAYEMTDDDRYLKEAQESIRYLLNDMAYTMENDRYTREYTDPVDFPITEIFGNAYGVAAAQRIFNITGDEEYLKYSKDFLNSLLRMAFWYDDEISPYSKDLNNLGLFRVHGGSYQTCPWETVEACLPLTIVLKYNRSLPVYELLLKIFNLQRINSFYYYPGTWSERIISRNPEIYHSDYKYFPIEPFYMSEVGGHDTMGSTLYMSSLAMWNYLLYEGLAQVDDRKVMVLNLDVLDGFDLSVNSVQRSFVMYNPTDECRESLLYMKSLSDGDYNLVVMSAFGEVLHEGVYTSAQLCSGLPFTLRAQTYCYVNMNNTEAEEMRTHATRLVEAQNKICYAYQLVREEIERCVESHLLQYVSKGVLETLPTSVSYEYAIMITSYADDPDNGIDNKAGFLSWAISNMWKPKSEWVQSYRQDFEKNQGVGNSVSKRVQELKHAVQKAKQLYDKDCYDKAIKQAQAIIDDLLS